MNVTPKAVEKLKEYKPSENDVLFVSILGAGCAGLSYQMGWKPKFLAHEEKDKKLFEDKDMGIVVFTNGRSSLFLEEAELDFSDGLNGRGFEWLNPISKKVCGCGNSFST